MGFNAMTLRNYPPNQIAMLNRTAMGFIGRTFEESPLSMNGMQDGVQSAAMAGLLRNYRLTKIAGPFACLPPPVRYAPTVKDHVSLHTKS